MRYIFAGLIGLMLAFQNCSDQQFRSTQKNLENQNLSLPSANIVTSNCDTSVISDDHCAPVEAGNGSGYVGIEAPKSAAEGDIVRVVASGGVPPYTLTSTPSGYLVGASDPNAGIFDLYISGGDLRLLFPGQALVPVEVTIDDSSTTTLSTTVSIEYTIPNP